MLGIDVSKATLSCTLTRAATRQVLWETTVPNTPRGVQRLLRATPAADAWVVEPTGRYSQPVVTQAQAAGRTVLLAQPKRARAFLASLYPRAKTDRLDSHGLALYGLAADLRPYPGTSETMERIDQLLAARKQISLSVSRLRQQQMALPHAASALAAAVAGLGEQLRAVDQQLAQATRTPDGERLALVAALDEVPGIGPVTAAAVASCLERGQFGHPDAFVAYIGLDVRVRDSGQRTGRRTLSKQGDAEIRRLLYVCALANTRSRDAGNPFKAQYEREREKGLATTAAVNAVARKLAKVCWSLHRHGTRYEAGRVHTQPSARTAVPLDSEP